MTRILWELWDIHKTDGKANIIHQPPSPLPILEVSMQCPALFNCVFCVKHTPLQRHIFSCKWGFETWLGTQRRDQVSLLSGILLEFSVCFFGLMLGTLATKKQSHVQMVFLNFVKSPDHIFRKSSQKLSDSDTEVMEVDLPNWEFEQIYFPA